MNTIVNVFYGLDNYAEPKDFKNSEYTNNTITVK